MEKNLKIRNRPKCIKKAMANNKGGGNASNKLRKKRIIQRNVMVTHIWESINRPIALLHNSNQSNFLLD